MSATDDDRRKLIANERAKLTATFLNGIAIALIAVGALAPSFGPKTPAMPGDGALVVLALSRLVCLLGAVTLHVMARYILGSLR